LSLLRRQWVADLAAHGKHGFTRSSPFRTAPPPPKTSSNFGDLSSLHDVHVGIFLGFRDSVKPGSLLLDEVVVSFIAGLIV
jgi:hypothetical protein